MCNAWVEINSRTTGEGVEEIFFIVAERRWNVDKFLSRSLIAYFFY